MNKDKTSFEHLTPDECWRITYTRNKAYDGVFVSAVKTTGIYCRPSCPARKPKRQNVIFFATCHEAEQAGFRACLRCRPTERPFEAKIVEKTCHYLKLHFSHSATLADLGSYVDLSPTYLQRIFKQSLGISPREYMDWCRLNDFKKRLRNGESIANASFSAGYGSSSRVYERVPSQIGMTPAEYQQGGSGITVQYVITDSHLGRILIGATQRGICFVDIGDKDENLLSRLREEFPQSRLQISNDFAPVVRKYLVRNDNSQLPLDIPPHIKHDAFKQSIMAAIREDIMRTFCES